MTTAVNTSRDLKELLDLVLEVGDMARKLEQLQYRLSQKLGELTERDGLSLEQVMFSQ